MTEPRYMEHHQTAVNTASLGRCIKHEQELRETLLSCLMKYI